MNSSCSCVDIDNDCMCEIFPFHCLDDESFIETVSLVHASNFNHMCNTDIQDLMSILETEGDSVYNNCSYFSVDKFNKEYSDGDKNLSQSFIHFNCRSLKKNFEYLDLSLYLLKHIFKIIGLTETWLTDTSPVELYQLHDYVLLTNHRQKKRGGGTALYIHKSMPFIERKDLTVVHDSFESLFVEIPVKGTHKLVGVIYRPLNQSIDDFFGTNNSPFE